MKTEEKGDDIGEPKGKDQLKGRIRNGTRGAETTLNLGVVIHDFSDFRKWGCNQRADQAVRRQGSD